MYCGLMGADMLEFAVDNLGMMILPAWKEQRGEMSKMQMLHAD